VDDHIHLTTNAPTNIYIAVNMKVDNPLPGDFLDTQEVMSVLRIAKENGAPEKIIKAKESRPFRIYKKSYGKGDINIPLTIPKANPSTTFILFYGIDPNAARPLACGGE